MITLSALATGIMVGQMVLETISDRKKNQKDKETTKDSSEKITTDEDAFKQIESRPQAGIFKTMLDNANINIPILANYLGYKEQSLRNKFSRDTFTIDELVIAAYACDFDIVFKKKDSKDCFVIDAESYLSGRSEETWKRVSQYKSSDYAEKRAEYDALMARIAELKKDYKFDENK